MKSIFMVRCFGSFFAFTGTCTNGLPSSTQFLPCRDIYSDPRPPASTHPPHRSLACLPSSSVILDSSQHQQLTPVRQHPWTRFGISARPPPDPPPCLPHRSSHCQQLTRYPRPPPQPPPRPPDPTTLAFSRYQQLTRPRRRRRPPLNPDSTSSRPASSTHRTHLYFWQSAFVASLFAFEFIDFQEFQASSHLAEFKASTAFGASIVSSLGLLIVVFTVLCFSGALLTGRVSLILRFASLLTSDLTNL